MPNKVTSLRNHGGSWGRSRERTQCGSRWYLLECEPIEKWASIDSRPAAGVPAPPIPPGMRVRWAASSSCSSARSAPSSASHAKSPAGPDRRASKGPSNPSCHLSEMCRDLLEKRHVDKLDNEARNYLLEMAQQIYPGSPTEYFYMPNQSDTMYDEAIEISSEEQRAVKRGTSMRVLSAARRAADHLAMEQRVGEIFFGAAVPPYRQHPRVCDVIGVFAGVANLSFRVSRFGLTAGEPIDIACDWDLRSAEKPRACAPTFLRRAPTSWSSASPAPSGAASPT